MVSVIAVTSIREQQDVLAYIRERLKLEHHSDTTITVTQPSLSRIDVYQTVNGMQHLAMRYNIVLISLTISYENLLGFPQTTNINITRVLAKLEKMKANIIDIANKTKLPSPAEKKQREALSKAAKQLFN